MTGQGDGLREDELASIETTYRLRFPPDLRAFLHEGRGISSRDWMDWRAPRSEIESRLAAPFEDIVPFFETTEYWLPQWGDRPAAVEDRLKFLSNAPVLIPIAGGHYMAAEPSDAGNPIFSIVGIDMIVAGCDLADYLAGGPRSVATKGAARHIRFWSDVLYTHWDGWVDVIRRELTGE